MSSSLAVTIRVPSGLYAADLTLSLWPVRVRSSVPVVASQILAVPSPLAVTIRVPSGLYAADNTEKPTVAVRSSVPVVASQILAEGRS